MPQHGTVLIADDHEASLSGLCALLEAEGYVVSAASTGTEALRLAIERRPDVVLLDVVMPGISGIEVCRELKQAPTTRLTPVILISAHSDRANRLAGIDAGADDFLGKPVDPEELRTRLRSSLRLKRLTSELESAEALFLTLGRIVEARDPDTEGHCERLALYATALGASLGLERDEQHALYLGAFLHDVGKIAIPDRVLLKKGRLSQAEFELMKQHPLTGDALCSTLQSLEAVRPIVRHHHERLDGRGYPDGLRGDRIPLLARIVSVVEMFDALTTDRPYRRALPATTAYRMLLDEARAGWTSEELVERFIALHRDGTLSGEPRTRRVSSRPAQLASGLR